MEHVIDLELSLGERDFSSTEFILEFDQLVLKLDPPLALVVEVGLEAILGLSELLPLVFQHELNLSQSAVLISHLVRAGLLLGETLLKLRVALLWPR